MSFEKHHLLEFALGFAVLGGLSALLNIYLGYLYEPLHRLTHHGQAPARIPSGLATSMLLWIAIPFFWWMGYSSALWVCLGLGLIEPMGPPALIYYSYRHRMSVR